MKLLEGGNQCYASHRKAEKKSKYLRPEGVGDQLIWGDGGCGDGDWGSSKPLFSHETSLTLTSFP